MSEASTVTAGSTRQGLALILPATLAVMASAALAPTLPLLFKAFAGVAGGAWLVPMVLTLPAVFMILTSPLAGWLGDRYGRRRLLIIGLICYAAFGLGAMAIGNLYLLLADRALVGIAEAFAMTLCTTLLGDTYAGEERSRWLGYQVALASLSAILYIAVGGFLGSFGWRVSFAIYATPLLFALLVARWTREPVVAASAAHAAVPFPWRAMALIWPITLVGGILFYTAQLQSGVALDAIGFTDPRLIGLMLAGAAIATVVGALAFRKMVGMPPARLLGISFALIGIGFLTIGRATTVAMLASGLVVAQLGCGVLLPTTLSWALGRLPFEVRGRGMGTSQGVFSFGQFLAPLIATGLIRGVAPGLRGIATAFALLGVAALVAAVGALAIILTLPRGRDVAGGAPPSGTAAR